MTYSHLSPGPGEDEKIALERRVKMHEFLIPGGVQTGIVNGKMTYSDPIVIHEHEECPWHETADCEAWNVIREGKGPQGILDKLESDLVDLQYEIKLALASEDPEDAETDVMALVEEVESLEKRILIQRAKVNTGIPLNTLRKMHAEPDFPGNHDHEPFWALRRGPKAGDQADKPDENTILCNAHQASANIRAEMIGLAELDTVMGSWFRVPQEGRECIACVLGHPITPSFGNGSSYRGPGGHGYQQPGGGGHGYGYDRNGYPGRYVPPKEKDARDDAVKVFAASEVPDEIVFEEGEEEDDDE